MTNLPRVAAVVLMASVIFGPAVVLARSGGHAPDIRVPEVHQPRDVKVPDVKVPDVKIPDVKVPEVRVPQAAVRDNAPTGATAASGGAAAASSRVPVTPGNVISDVVATRSFDSRAAFLNSPVATRVGQGAGSPETKLLADYQKDGRRCRDYQQTVLIAAQRVKAVGTVCQGGDGKWGLVPFQRPAQPTAGQGTSRAAADQ